MDDDNSDFIGFSPIKSQTSSNDSQDVVQDVISEDDIALANARAKLLHVHKPGINFVAGSVLECLESRDDKWYKCKIVEVDWGELDILVHYNRWSKKFDEWLKMDSTRIRPLTNIRQELLPMFSVGEKVLGFWCLDSNFYLGEVTKSSSNSTDFYEVRFYDGITKTLRSSQMKKISNKEANGYLKSLTDSAVRGSSKIPPCEIEEKFVQSPSTPSIIPSSTTLAKIAVTTDTVASESPQQRHASLKGYAYVPETSKVNIFNVEIFEQKRKTKRKPEVEQLFASTKKKRKADEAFHESDANVSNNMATSTDLSPAPVKPLEMASSTKVSIEQHPPAAKKRKIEKVPPEILEIDLGLNWKKVARRAHLKKKWNIYYVTPDNEEIRTRQQFLQSYQRLTCPITPADVDFCTKMFNLEHEANYGGVNINFDAKRKSISSEPGFSGIYTELDVEKPKILNDSFSSTSSSSSASSSSSWDSSSSSNSSQNSRENSSIDQEAASSPYNLQSTDSEDSTDSDDSAGDSSTVSSQSSIKLNQLFSSPMPLHIEIPAKETFEGFATSSKIENRKTSPIPDKLTPKYRSGRPQHLIKSPSILMEPKAEHGHMCPKEGCEKSFRKESLLQMHMKHYHPELKSCKNLSSARPNASVLKSVSEDCDLDNIPIATRLSTIGTRSSKKPSPLSSEGRKYGYKERHKSKRSFKQEDETKKDLKTEPKIPMKEINPIKTENEAVPVVIKSEEVPEPKAVAKKKDSVIIEREGVTTRQTRRSETVSEFDDETTESIAENQSEDSPDAIINCGCKSTEEDGLMIQCDICLCWQHGGCYNIESEDQVPDSYICSLCDFPRGERSSMKFRHHQDWLKKGRLLKLSISAGKKNPKLENYIMRGHELSANVLQLSPLIHSLRLKLSIAKEVDHPKFVMWHKEWVDEDNGFVEPEGTHLSHTMSSDLIRSSSKQTVSNILDESVSINPVQFETSMLSVPINNTAAGTSTFSPSSFNQPEEKIGEDSLSRPSQSGTSSSFEKTASDEAALTFSSEIIEEHKSQAIIKELDPKLIAHKSELKSELPKDIDESSPDSVVVPQISSDINEQNTCLLSSLCEKIIPEKDPLSAEENRTEEAKESIQVLSSENQTEEPMEGIQESVPVDNVADAFEEADTVTESDSNKTLGTNDDELINSQNIETCSKVKIVEQVESLELKTDAKNDDFESDSSNERQTKKLYVEINTNEFNQVDEQKDIIPNDRNLREGNSMRIIDENSSKQILDIELGLLNQNDLKFASEQNNASVALKENEIVEDSVKENETVEDSVKENEIVEDSAEEKVILEDSVKENEIVEDYMKENKMVEDSRKENETEDSVEEKVILEDSVKEKLILEDSVKENEILEDSVSKTSSLLGTNDPTEVEKVILEESNLINDLGSIPTLEEQDLHKAFEDDVLAKTIPKDSSSEDIELKNFSHKEEEALEVANDLDIELGGLSAGSGPDMNDGNVLTELLSHPAFDLIGQDTCEYAPFEPTTPAPIIPETERIEPSKCKVNLLKHIEQVQNKVFDQFDYIEKQLHILEAEMGLTSEISKEEEELLNNDLSFARDPATIQARSLVQLLLNNFDTVSKMADYGIPTNISKDSV